MNHHLAVRPSFFLILTAGLFLLIAGSTAAWLGQMVLDPARLSDVTAEGSSTLTEPHAFFSSHVLNGKGGETIQVPVSIDSNGGSRSTITADLYYTPTQAIVQADFTGSTCAAVTKREQDELAGHFSVSCTAPSGAGTKQVEHFVTFLVTPYKAGSVPLTLEGRRSDYAVILAQ